MSTLLDTVRYGCPGSLKNRLTNGTKIGACVETCAVMTPSSAVPEAPAHAVVGDPVGNCWDERFTVKFAGFTKPKSLLDEWNAATQALRASVGLEQFFVAAAGNSWESIGLSDPVRAASLAAVSTANCE